MGIKEDAIQEAKDAKMRVMAEKAYNKAMPEPDTTTGDFDNYRKQKQGEISGRKAANAAADAAKSDRLAKAQYDRSVRDYERELALDPADKNPIGYNLRKFGDTVGDKMRGAGEFFGINNMTSMDDKAQMKARQDVKGYKKGGMTKKMASGGKVSSASRRADGIATKGKTRGTMIAMCGGGMYKGKK
jgi:hypothetical protein